MAAAVGIYVRISKDREGAGLGVERQESECRELARRKRWKVVEVYSDNDISAYSGKPRPGYWRMLEDIKAGRITTVVAWHTDRLHRSPAELEEYITVCEPRDVPTHTVKIGNLDLSTPAGRMVARQLGAVARYEVEHMIERQQSAKAQKAAAGQWKGGRRPYGYEADGVTVREAEADVIRELADGLLAGRSLRSMTADLNRRGLTTSTGARWRDDVVRSVLKRPRNAGLMEHQGRVLEGVRAEWPQILPEDTWRAVVGVLADPDRRTSPGTVPSWRLSGIAACGVCGAGVHATRVGKAGAVTAYRCKASAHLTRNAAEVDRMVDAVMIARLSRKDALKLLNTRPRKDNAKLYNEQKALRTRLDQLAEQFADGAIDARQLKAGTERITSKLAEVNDAIAYSARGSILSGVVDAEDVAAAWMALPMDRKRTIIAAFLTVQIKRSGRGRPAGWKKGESYFDPTTVSIEWKKTPTR